MTVAPQGQLTLQLNKLVSWHLPVAVVTGPCQPFVSSGTEGIAACALIPWPGPTALPHVGRIPLGRPFAEASIACAKQATSRR